MKVSARFWLVPDKGSPRENEWCALAGRSWLAAVTDIRGDCEDRFSKVREVLAASLESEDVGASAAVFVDGEPVVDLWGGYVDPGRTKAWDRDTITTVWSTTKTMTALCALVLADRGELDLDAPVAAYWPEFAAAGKESTLVRHLLGHTAGLPDFTGPIEVEDLFDWPAVTARLAAQAPAWEPGTAGGYHSVTFGFLVGEVVRRVTGRSLGTFFAEEVAGPLGADFHIGLATEHDHRVAPLIPDPQGDKPPGFLVGVSDSYSEAWRRAEVPAINGYGNARSVAAAQSALVGGGGLLSAAGAERVFEEQFHGEDRVLGAQMRYGLGYRLEGRTCSWGGWGGSVVLVDAENRMVVAYVMNQVLWDGGYDRGLGVVMAAYDGITG